MKLSIKYLTFASMTLCAWAQPQAPSTLQAKSATKSAVQLIWTANDSAAVNYRIDRRPLGTSSTSFVTIGTATTAAYTDTIIDPMATYIYRVRATDSAGLISDGSNEITIGPPPVGSSLVSPLRLSLNFSDTTQFGTRPLMVLDSNGDPAVMYSVLSPNSFIQDNTGPDSFLEFVSWDRTQYAWKTPVKVGVTGDTTPSGGGSNNYSLARDPSTNTWAIASLIAAPDFQNFEIRLFVSNDNGAVWKPVSAVTDPVYNLANVTVALSGGLIHMSYYQDYNGIVYLTGKLTDPPTKWTATLAPLPAGASDYRQGNHLALDSKGKPGIVFYSSADGYNSVVTYWRPGDGTSTYVTDSNHVQNDFVEVKLAYFGTSARIAAQLIRDDQGPSGYDRFFWVMADSGGGVFNPPSGLPSDGNSDLGYGSFALGSAGQAALVTARTGGNDSGVVCGDPKITRSTDLVNWTTCSPYGPNPQPYRDAYWPQAAYAVNNKLYIALSNYDDASPLYGIVLWREQ